MTAILATPLRLERNAVRRAGRNMRLVRTGMGRAATLPPTRAPVLVAGVAGGLAPEVRPGDVVVADSVTDGRRRIDIPSAPLLAAALRRRDLTVHCGQIRTTDRIATGARRATLARTGALAVDMESFALAEAALGPVAVVRSIVDVEGQGLWTPGTIVRGRRALRVLRDAVPALEEWAAATGSRQIADARDADLVLVVGATDPADSRREGTPAHLVDDAGGIDLRWLAGARRIAIIAGESAPPSLVDEVTRALSGLDPDHRAQPEEVS
jgi:hypothetical protein